MWRVRSVLWLLCLAPLLASYPGFSAAAPSSPPPAAAPPHAAYWSDDPAAFVRVQNGKLVLGSTPFVIRGTNYFGSWRSTRPLVARQGIELMNTWVFYQLWSTADIDKDMQLLRSQLGATVLRVPLPTVPDFENDVRYHGFSPWFSPDGSIAPEYASKLVQLADLAAKNDIRLELCLLWRVNAEIEHSPDAFLPGGEKDQFYANQVRSVARLLQHHPGVIAYSIGNEVLLNWKLNGNQRSWFEVRAVGFLLRRIADLRATAPHQLVTTDEIVGRRATTWVGPGVVLAPIPDSDGVNGGQPMRLADSVDYLGIHFYPEVLTPQDVGNFGTKAADAAAVLGDFLRAARATGKPVVVNEIGLKMRPQTLSPQDYGPARDQFYERVLDEGQADGLQGMLVWYALPELEMRPGVFQVRESSINPYSPIELDSPSVGGPRRILLYEPYFELFTWNATGDEPVPSAAAKALATAWPGVPPPPAPVRNPG